MKRIITLVLVFALMLSMSACINTEQEYAHNSDINTETQGTTASEGAASATQPVEKDGQKLTASVLLGRISAGLAKDDLDPISNVETKSGTERGQKVTTFICVNGLVSVSVTETDGIVDYVIALCLPSQVMQKVSSESLAEAAIGAYAYSMIPLFSCEPKIDSGWHQEQFMNAPDEGDASIVIRSYTSDEWYYTAMIGEAVVTCLAARYCNQCKNNAPNVSFTSGAKICDTCNNPSNNTSVNGGNASQQPTVCSHNYANATCTEPKTCINCGQTSGSALGHSWKNATCAAPQTCTVCGQTKGSPTYDHNWVFTSCTTPKACSFCGEVIIGGNMPGHIWKNATCTEPEHCTVCGEIGAAARGHRMRFTKCLNCDYTDYSYIADTYTNVSVDAYIFGTTTAVDLEVTNVSVSQSGVLSFTFNGKNYDLTVKQNDESDTYMGYFDCYIDGVLVEDVNFRAGSQLYYNAIYLDRFIADGYKLYIYATR